MFGQKMQLGAVIFTVALVSFTAGTVAQGRFPWINQAEGSLRTALGQMSAGRDIFGGHKVNAENLVNQAIGELEAGKAYAASQGY